ncbi:PleD family two-component system response regulator [Pseudovibrio exalbescens]|uniref:PleD family two-component system response regulator n=1 Tax=Pseudovibrio exalbescens TaxID=197461 RepID=UPI002365769E|nr:PleD family two-component system response regulator [Pseudovibrio exalbescens]MDD7910691.1 PleD family two-component system response regulator [Pseudovibrio exalbescens]
MTGRILVVDDIEANLRLLAARLAADYFEVTTASNGHEALEAMESNAFDVVLLDVMMPDIDGFEVCRRIKQSPRTAHIPVVLITALKHQSDRLRGYEAGADDFISKPVDDVELVIRVRNLIRMKRAMDELRMRARTGQDLNLQMSEPELQEPVTDASVFLVDSDLASVKQIEGYLAGHFTVISEGRPGRAVYRCVEDDPDLVLINGNIDATDPLRLCAQLRSNEHTRMIPIIFLSSQRDKRRLIKAMDIGVNDFVEQPIDPSEFILRCTTQVRQKRTSDALLRAMQETVEMAVTDALTGLYNRRYFEHHAGAHIARAIKEGKFLSLLLLDVDHFKSINDKYGHDVGDEVLVEFAHRLRRNVRGLDLVCRYGGEEFVIVTPETDQKVALTVAERLRAEIAAMPFTVVGKTEKIPITASIGVATLQSTDETTASLVKRADQGLYSAKNGGRNQVQLNLIDPQDNHCL